MQPDNLDSSPYAGVRARPVNHPVRGIPVRGIPARLTCVVLAFSLMTVLPPAYAGGGGLTGGSTEITQLLNHGELIASVAQQAQMVGQNVAAQIQRIQQTITMLQNLKQIPESLLSQTIAPYMSQINNFRSLMTTVTSLGQQANQVRNLFSRSMSEMSVTGLSPSQWLSSYATLAKQRGGTFQQQLTADMQSIQTLAQRAQSLQQIQSSIPGVTGSVQGLQTLNQQSSVMAGELVDLHALMQRQVTQQMQDQSDTAQSQANAAQLALARNARMNEVMQQEQQTLQAAPGFQPLHDQ